MSTNKQITAIKWFFKNYTGFLIGIAFFITAIGAGFSFMLEKSYPLILSTIATLIAYWVLLIKDVKPYYRAIMRVNKQLGYDEVKPFSKKIHNFLMKK
jgi:hypothetical protein